MSVPAYTSIVTERGERLTAMRHESHRLSVTFAVGMVSASILVPVEDARRYAHLMLAQCDAADAERVSEQVTA